MPLPPGTGNGGYDASALDSLGRMMLTPKGFRQVATMLVEAAGELSGGRIVCSHEGGYDEAYAPFCTHAVIEALAPVETPYPDPFRFDPSATSIEPAFHCG